MPAIGINSFPGVPIIGGGSFGTPTRVTGGNFNAIANNKTIGPGGDYPTGVVGLAAGTWTWNPFSGLTGYARPFDGSLVNNNWLTFVEADGPNTVHFDLRPDSTGSFGNSTGGGFWVTGAGGSLRWIFFGGFSWENGSTRFDASPAVDRIIWYGNKRTFPSSEYSRQVAGTSNLKGNDDPAALRFQRNATRMYAIRELINDVCDDGVFVGSGCDTVDVIGAAISRIRNNGVGGFHNDGAQISGGNKFRVLDSTLLNASFQLVAEAGQGNITNMVVDRCMNGLNTSSTLGALGPNGGTLNNTNQVAQGAPDTRVTGHYLKTFANGVDDHSAGSQFAITSGAFTNHVGIIDYGSHSVVVNTGNTSVSIPSGVAGGLDSNGLPTNVEASTVAALASPDAPHQAFGAQYGMNAADFFQCLIDYGILLN